MSPRALTGMVSRALHDPALCQAPPAPTPYFSASRRIPASMLFLKPSQLPAALSLSRSPRDLGAGEEGGSAGGEQP